MRLTQQANQRPFHCAVIPYKGNSNASGFIDTGQFLGDDKVFVSFEGATLLAKRIGWHGPTEAKQRAEEIAALNARIEQLEAELAEADKLVEASRYSLEKFGSKVQNKPGRKPKDKVEA